MQQASFYSGSAHPEALPGRDAQNHAEALKIAYSILSGQIPDPTDGATSFYHDQQPEKRSIFREVSTCSNIEAASGVLAAWQWSMLQAGVGRARGHLTAHLYGAEFK